MIIHGFGFKLLNFDFLVTGITRGLMVQLLSATQMVLCSNPGLTIFFFLFNHDFPCGKLNERQPYKNVDLDKTYTLAKMGRSKIGWFFNRMGSTLNNLQF